MNEPLDDASYIRFQYIVHVLGGPNANLQSSWQGVEDACQRYGIGTTPKPRTPGCRCGACPKCAYRAQHAKYMIKRRRHASCGSGRIRASRFA
jgi:hypothetical protein